MLSPKLINQIVAIAQTFPISKIVLFGSRAYGDHHDRSDIDLAVIASDMSEQDWVTFADSLDEELETLLKLDIINYSEASSKLKEEINKCHIVLYERQSDPTTYKQGIY